MVTGDQSNYYSINPGGLNDIKLNANIKLLPDLKSLSEDDHREYSFSPSPERFNSLTIDSARKHSSLSLTSLFVATDGAHNIKKIIMFLEGNLSELLFYFYFHLQCEHVVLESFRNNAQYASYYTWRPTDHSMVSMADFSYIYRMNVFMVEFYSNPEVVSKYTVVRKFE